MLTMIIILTLAIILHIIFWKNISEYLEDDFMHFVFGILIYPALIAGAFIVIDQLTNRMVSVETKEYPLVKIDNRYFTKTVDRFGIPYFNFTWLLENNVNTSSTRSFTQSDKAVVVVQFTTGKDSIWLFNIDTRVNIVEVRGPLEDITGEKVVEKG